jgi:serine/threonine protein kinase
MGAVYKARQKKLDRLVAIKILPPETAGEPAFAERFMREARSLARLNHPNIVTVYDFGDTDGLFYFTMEYVDGHNLRDLLQPGALPTAQVRLIVPQVCDALQYAHDQGLVHRDIKPENILLDRNGRVNIADFGLARLVGLTPSYLTLTGTHEVMGTLLYMAPEQMKRAHTVDHRADIYSLGVVLYEMLTGELPLGRFAPPSHKSAVDEQLDQVVLRALAREPADRYQDAAAFRQDVERALEVAVPGRSDSWSAERPGHRLPPSNRQIWPSARFHIPSPHDHGGQTVLARGLIGRDEQALILEFDHAKKSVVKMFKSFFKDPGQPQEVRIPFHQIASLSYGWGWCRPPRSLLLRVRQLAVLAGMPGATQGQVQLMIPREDRLAARHLVESIGGDVLAAGGPAQVGVRFDQEQARSEVQIPALGLLLTGAVTLLSLGAAVLVLAMTKKSMLLETPVGLIVAPCVVLIVAVSGLMMAGAAMMMRLRTFPLAAMAAILAMVPWSPGWLIGLPFGIWACIVLGRPQVVEGFLSSDDRRVSPTMVARPRPRGVIAGQLLSLLRSMRGYMMPTLHRRQSLEGNQLGEQSSIKS